MNGHGGAPAPRPCGSCPYRCDVPSGVWSEAEYAKLPAYDAAETGDQPISAFFCHQQDGRLCAGWVGCHDMAESMGLRLAVSFGTVTPEAFELAVDYETDVPLFESGAAAAAHGLAEIERPSEAACRVVERLARKLT